MLFQCCGLAYSTERDELPARLRADVGAEEGGHGRRVLHGNLQEQIHLQPAHPRSGRKENRLCALNFSLCPLYLIHFRLCIRRQKRTNDFDFTMDGCVNSMISYLPSQFQFQAHESARLHHQRRTWTRTPSSSICHPKCRNRPPSERRETAFFDTKRRNLRRGGRRSRTGGCKISLWGHSGQMDLMHRPGPHIASSRNMIHVDDRPAEL